MFKILCLGAEEHGALCRPQQPHKDVAVIQAVDREDHGGVLPTGWQRARERDGDQRHVWQTHRVCGEESGNTWFLFLSLTQHDCVLVTRLPSSENMVGEVKNHLVRLSAVDIHKLYSCGGNSGQRETPANINTQRQSPKQKWKTKHKLAM